MADRPSGPEVISCRIRADEGSVRQFLGHVVARLAPAIDGEDCGTVELVLAEVLNNIVEHAFAHRTPGTARVELTQGADGLLCNIEDEGLPMPGLRLPEGRVRPPADRVEDFDEGGWGWGLIHALTADLRYERRGGTNHLAFRIPLAARP